MKEPEQGEEQNDESKCKGCGKNPAQEEHTCPFAEEIHNDTRTCNCCDKCAYECAMEI
jgi:hypothetical protein